MIASRMAVVAASWCLVAGSAAAADLVAAARVNDRGAALAELGRGADAKLRSADGTTALHWAVYHADADLVDRLLDAGADPNA
ncbi:MAG TPA: ankyrin repeat domain-containing protein, partial [Gammaproteobacteria bacterium]|nr:ankyrin repeat domain-containing protein [Gammaproteobacteria bacterium]